jgi:hypothetical protein
MTATTSRGYPFPEYDDANSFPAQDQALATAIDTDLDMNLRDPIVLALDEPSARASRPAGTQAIANNTDVALSYTTENYDNNGMINLAGSATNVVIQTTGTYLISGSANAQPDTSATGALALVLTSSGGVTLNPGGSSRDLDNDKDTSVSITTLHRVTVVPETITLVARHNHGASLNVSIAQLTVTRISA